MTLRHRMTTAVALLLTAVVPQVASAGFTTWSAPGGEPSVFEILDDTYGLQNLERMHDFDAAETDQIWTNSGIVEVSVLAKYSRLSQTFGFMAGDGKTFTSLFDVHGQGRSLAYTSSFDVDASGSRFRFSNEPSGDRTASSRMAENLNGVDQMVSWRLSDPTASLSDFDTYVIAFEDRPGRLASADYNDLIIQVKTKRGDEDPGAEPVPEPATLVLLGMGAAGLAASRRKKR